MNYSILIAAGRIACAGLLGSAGLAGAAAAQQPAPKGAPAVAPPSIQVAQQGDIIPVGWVKLCRKYTATTTNKDGTEVNQDLNICLTKNETIYLSSGKVRSSVAIRQIDNEAKLYLMVTVPLELNLKPGVRAAVFPKAIWEKSQKGEQLSKADEAGLKPLNLVYTQCHPAGCDAEGEATPQLISELKSGGGLMLFAFNASGRPDPYPVPLAGFAKAFADPPITEQSYNDTRRKLMRQVEQQQEIRGTIVLPKKLP